jgi:hypothetical protein
MRIQPASCARFSAAVALILFLTSLASAQEEIAKTRPKLGGPFLGVLFTGASLRTDKYISDSTARTASGPGLGIQGGWDFPFGVSFFADWEQAAIKREIGDYSFRNIDAGVRLRGVQLRRVLGGVVPYVEVAANDRSIFQAQVRREGHVYPNPPKAFDEAPFPNVESNSRGSMVGGGIEYPLTSRFRLNAGIKVTSGAFDRIMFGGGFVEGWDFTARSRLLSLGITWHGV